MPAPPAAGSTPRLSGRIDQPAGPAAASLSSQPSAREPLATPPLPAAPSLEEQLGARLPVWIGSIALALAGAFLVKYSLDQGWLSPAVRVGGGFGFGLLLLAAGERLRRPSPRVSQGLSAAGVADLFACVLAAVQLYGLISPGLGFALAVAVTALAVLLSLRQGPMVALIGLVGGFLAPAWIRPGEPDARNLFSYLLLLEVALLATSRRRGWPGVALLATGAGLLWALAWIVGSFQPADAAWVELFLLLTAAAAVAAALGGDAAWAGRTPVVALAGGTAACGLLATSLVAYRTGFSPQEWVFFGLLAAGLMVLGRIDGSFAGLAWLAAGVGAALLIIWSDDVEARRQVLTAFTLGTLFAGGGALAAVAWPRRGSPQPGLWMALSSAAAVGYFLIAYGAGEPHGVAMPWGGLALGLGALYAAGASALGSLQGRPASPGGAVVPPGTGAPSVKPDLSPAVAAAAVAATAFVSLAAPIALERSWLSVAWALEVPVLVALAGRFRLPVLTLLARILALLVLARLAVNPGVLGYPIGEGLLFNWLLFGFGVPLLALAGGAWLARQEGDRETAALLELGTLAIALGYATLEIGQIYHPGEPGATPIPLSQWGSWTVAWLGLGAAAIALGRRSGRGELAAGGVVVVWLGLAGTFLAQGLIANPLWRHSAVGATPLANLLLWLYGAPALLLVLAAREVSLPGAPPAPVGGAAGAPRPEDRSPWLTGNVGSRTVASLSAPLWRIAALALAFLLVSLEVRQLFHGEYLDRSLAAGPGSTAERWAYSAAWALFATALLIAGIARRGRLLRRASLAVMTAAVLKVFLYDTANLTGLYRVGSLLGLGVALLLLAHLYGRFVFREGGSR